MSEQIWVLGPTAAQVAKGRGYHRIIWHDEHGTRRTASGSKSATEAITKAGTYALKITRGLDPADKATITVEDGVKRWVADKSHDWSETYTYAAPQFLHRWLNPIWNKPLTQITRTNIQLCLDDMAEPGISVHTGKPRPASTRAQQVQLIRHINPCFKHLYAKRLIPHPHDTYTEGLELRAPEKPTNASGNRLTIETHEVPNSIFVQGMVNKFEQLAREVQSDKDRRKNWRGRDNFDNFIEGTRIAILLMAYAGLRVGEARALTFGDIQRSASSSVDHTLIPSFINGKLTINKNLTENPKGTVLGVPKKKKVRTAVFPSFTQPIIMPGLNDTVNGKKIPTNITARELFQSYGIEKPTFSITREDMEEAGINPHEYGLISIIQIIRHAMSKAIEQYSDDWKQVVVWQPAGNTQCIHLPQGVDSPPPNGNWIQPKYFNRTWWNPIREQLPYAENKWQLRSLRHHFASYNLQRGKDVAWISNRMGHANPHITLQVYTHFMDNNNSNDFFESDY